MSDDKKKPYADPKKVPLIIQDMERDLGRDVKKAGSIVGDLLFGNFFDRHGFSGKPPQEPEPPRPARIESVPEPKTLPVADAEVIEETGCLTCDGRGKLGAKGHEVPCPVCGGCKTCAGRGKLGRAGHEIPCPVCQGK